ncbi:NAD-dependent epimerase/dehydratase family protein [Janibacter sp. YIM B02568]|uniref:NAD-dependent epimerase/dehydratase family protein n=1 Tax=Janibacter endophyticus TaxID=2806261 RepID=UPI0019506211|nr:NAD-dependent epimerase/dehydratase family protein [Janibacter endophyticus]MBM6545756.1 NAD-dependent epimerase/dehydratase family protein [Janibacter endophyticus]
MKLLITGGAGFIGSNLAELAMSRDHSVTVVDNLVTGHRENLEGLDVDFHEMSVTETDRLEAVMAGHHSVVHLAALGSVPRSINAPFPTHETNATGTLSVLEAARAAGVSHVMVSGSSSVYGSNPALPKGEREWVRPMSPYAVTKLASEQYVLAYQNSYGMDTLAFRFFNVFGPRQRAGHAYAAVIPIFLDALLRGMALPVNGDGTNSRDFTYVGTVCRVLLDAAERRVTHPEPVNLAFGTNTNLNQLVTLMSEVTGIAAEVEYRDPRPGDVRHSQADNSSLTALFPGVAPTTLQTGLEETLTWFRSLETYDATANSKENQP